MSLRSKQVIIAVLGLIFLASLLLVQQREVARRQAEVGLGRHPVAIPASSQRCVECHTQTSRGIVDHWTGSTHAEKGVGCVECHQADEYDADAFPHYGEIIATIVSPRDCGACHEREQQEFAASHHAKGGNILASLDNRLAETIEGSREPFNPHSPTPGMNVTKVDGMASVNVGCRQCHGSKVALEATDGTLITFEQLEPGPDGKPTNREAVAKIKRDESGRPELSASSWPNTGIGRLNLDGSRGSCSACHSRHDFSPRRARQPENCGKCHLGPDHPQKEIYEESKHGVAFRDLLNQMNLDGERWVLGEDYSQAPTCATCHMSAHTQNGRRVTHNAGERISWTNRPPVSALLDTNAEGELVKETDPEKRAELVVDTWQSKRDRMKQVCTHCHTTNYVNAFYTQYDDFVINYNEKFAKPGQQIMGALRKAELITPAEFDEKIEWTWFYLWHHEGRRARHGASMMAPDYAHWHGMFEVAERFYQELIPEAREIAHQAGQVGKGQQGEQVLTVIDEILARPEHQWYEAEGRPLAAANRPRANDPAAEASSNGEQPARVDRPADGPQSADADESSKGDESSPDNDDSGSDE